MDLKNIVITNVINAVTVHSPKGRFDPMKNRKYYGISLCLSGQITYTQNGKEIISDPEHAVILPQGGSYTITGDRTGEFPVINFTCADFLCDTVTPIKIKNYELLVHLYEQIKKLLVSNRNRPKIMSLFYNMIDILAGEGYSYRLMPAIRYIENNYHRENLTNEEMARECRVSTVYFRKLFTEELKISPKQYVINLRLEHAKQLLTEGEMKMTAVSEACGFSNPYHFCRVFKNNVGVPPSVYRAQNRIVNA